MIGVRAYHSVWKINISQFTNLGILVPNATNQSFDTISPDTLEFYNGLGKEILQFLVYTNVEWEKWTRYIF